VKVRVGHLKESRSIDLRKQFEVLQLVSRNVGQCGPFRLLARPMTHKGFTVFRRPPLLGSGPSLLFNSPSLIASSSVAPFSSVSARFLTLSHALLSSPDLPLHRPWAVLARLGKEQVRASDRVSACEGGPLPHSHPQFSHKTTTFTSLSLSL
jgi:hypothetical protein